LGIGGHLNKNTKILLLGFLRITWVLFFNSNYLYLAIEIIKFNCQDNRIEEERGRTYKRKKLSLKKKEINDQNTEI